MENKKLSTTPYKGTTDTYPQDMINRRYIFDIWTKVAKKFGYEEYDTPLIEEAQLYRVKSGDEIANNQLYSFTDKGGREIALRPEMTPSLARMIAAKRNELTTPVRWFNIGRYYRYEKPQKGRKREFFQLNIDILGVATVEAELEIIQFVMAVMEEFKAPKNTYELKINNRYLLEYLLNDILQLSDSQKVLVSRAIDNYSKMESSNFEAYLKEIGLTDQQINKITDFLNWSLDDLRDLQDISKGADQLLELFTEAEQLSIENIKFDPSVVRGLQYYTGTVIEMFDVGSRENPRALFGGGRYDDLLSIFNEENLPAFGLGWGDITTEDYLRTYNLLPQSRTNTEIFVTLMSSTLYTDTVKVAQQLREEGLNTEMQLTETKLGNQLKYADKKGIPWVVVMGDEEIKDGVVNLKNMLTREEVTVPVENILERVKSQKE